MKITTVAGISELYWLNGITNIMITVKNVSPSGYKTFQLKYGLHCFRKPRGCFLQRVERSRYLCKGSFLIINVLVNTRGFARERRRSKVSLVTFYGDLSRSLILERH